MITKYWWGFSIFIVGVCYGQAALISQISYGRQFFLAILMGCIIDLSKKYVK